MITGLRLIMQRIGIRLRRHQGEYLLDQTEGLPYIEWSQTKPPPVQEVGARIRQEIERVTGVIRVDSWTTTWDAVAQEITCTGEIITEDGDIPLTVSPFSSTKPHNTMPVLVWL
jgi:hypothetical protein